MEVIFGMLSSAGLVHSVLANISMKISSYMKKGILYFTVNGFLGHFYATCLCLCRCLSQANAFLIQLFNLMVFANLLNANIVDVILTQSQVR